jgi:DnaK suppressor protein
MKKSEMKVYRDLLISIRSRLRGDVSHMADAALGSTKAESNGDRARMPIHMADVGTDAFEQEFTLSLMEHDEDILAKVEAALERIEDGVYGSCIECEAKIPKTRLNVLPYTPHCVKCAGKIEAR